MSRPKSPAELSGLGEGAELLLADHIDARGHWPGRTGLRDPHSLRNADQLRVLRERPELVDNGVEELLRYATAKIRSPC